MSELMKFPRQEKLSIAKGIYARLVERAQSGPPEPALDAFIEETKGIFSTLETHVGGAATVDGTRAALIAASDESDDVVDTWLRKIEAFLEAEALRRTGPNRERAKKLYAAAFPRGRAIVDDRIAEENAQCRAAIEVLRAPESADTLAAIELPSGWVEAFEAAVEKSDADYDALAKARGEKASHVSLGRSVEADWEDTMLRLRHYVAGRAKRNDEAKQDEGRKLLAPLTDAVTQMRAAAAARATLRAKKAPGDAPKGATDGADASKAAEGVKATAGQDSSTPS